MKVLTRWDTVYGERSYVLLSESEWEQDKLGNIGFWKLCWHKKEEDVKDIVGVVTDDGYVVPIKAWRTNYGLVVGARTIIGDVLFNNHDMTTENWLGMNGKAKQKARDTVVKEIKFARELVETGDPIFAVRATIGTKPGMSEKRIMKKAKSMMKRKGVQAEMKKLVEEAAERVGIDRDFVLARLKKLASGDGRVAVDAVKELSDIFELKEKKSAKTNFNLTASLPLTSEDMKALEAAKAHKLAEVAEAEVIND